MPVQEMAVVIGVASLVGNYSIWREVFKNEQIVLDEIDNAYTKWGLFKQMEPGTANRVIRSNGQI
jgi:hypothetical protein